MSYSRVVTLLSERVSDSQLVWLRNQNHPDDVSRRGDFFMTDIIRNLLQIITFARNILYV